MFVVLLPSGSRAWIWITAAPAFQAAIPCSTISSGCSGRLGQSALLCAPPVSAQVMIGLFAIVIEVDEDERQPCRPITAVRPRMRRRPLNQHVPRLEARLPLVQQRPDLPLQADR